MKLFVVLFLLILISAGCGGLQQKKAERPLASPSSEVYKSIRAGEIGKVEQALNQGLSPQAQNAQGVSLLMAASIRGQLEIIRLLLDRGADLHALDLDQQSCAHYAVGSRKGEVIEFLIKAGADFAKKDRFGFSPLLEWAETEKWELVRLQLEQNPSVKGLSEVRSELIARLTEAQKTELIALAQNSPP